MEKICTISSQKAKEFSDKDFPPGDLFLVIPLQNYTTPERALSEILLIAHDAEEIIEKFPFGSYTPKAEMLRHARLTRINDRDKEIILTGKVRYWMGSPMPKHPDQRTKKTKTQKKSRSGAIYTPENYNLSKLPEGF